jgi:hypothetical protein
MPSPRFHAAALLAVVTSLSLTACSAPPPSVEQVDDRAILPAAGLKKTDYVRHYRLTTLRDADALPFTTTSSPAKLDKPLKVWIAVYARTPSVWTDAPARLHVVAAGDALPEYVHGGCQVVNLIADAATGETLSSWCNIDDSQPGDQLTPIPHFTAKDSPFG